MYDKFKLHRYFVVYISYDGPKIKMGSNSEEEAKKHLTKSYKLYQLKE